MRITRGFSLTNFAIASSALAFQVFVLYPWHQRLDHDFSELKAEHLRYVREGESSRLAELKSIKGELEILKKRGTT
jgi:hypothetical protein